MKKTIAICLMMLLLSAVSACKLHKLVNTVTGSGVRKTEKRDLPSFKAIEMEGAVEVQAICQKPESFEIEGDDNILPLIKVEVRDGVLRIRTDEPYNSHEPVVVRLSAPNLESVKATGAGKFRIQDVKNDKFEVRSTGASNVTVSGETKDVEIRNTGAGAIDAHNLHAHNANVTSTGAAKVDVYASEKLDVTVSGVGSVSYSGDPKVVNKTVNGAGTVSKRADSSF
jgi:Putative auto-transporter adhesin, head GIN domain